MPIGDAIKYGILRTRDLVELYYGARMVASVIERSPGGGSSQAQLMPADPRRIRYEIIMENADPVHQSVFSIGSRISFANSDNQFFGVPPNGTIVVERDFLTDLDAVTMEVDWLVSGGNGTISVRETFLTPAPVDEIP